MNITENSTEDADIAEMNAFVEQALKKITLPPVESLIDAIDLAVDSWQDTGSPPPKKKLSKESIVHAF